MYKLKDSCSDSFGINIGGGGGVTVGTDCIFADTRLVDILFALPFIECLKC